MEENKSIWRDLAPYFLDKKCVLLIGLLFCVFEGFIYPLFGVWFSKVTSALLRFRLGKSTDVEWEVYWYCLYMVGVAFLGVVTNIVILLTFTLIA